MNFGRIVTFLCAASLLSAQCQGVGDFITKQNVQLTLTTVKSLAWLFARSQSFDLAGRKKSLISRVVESLTHVATCALEPERDLISKGAHGNAVLWQLLCHAQEMKMLKDVAGQLGDKDHDYEYDLFDDELVKLLQKHYHGPKVDEDWSSEYFVDDSSLLSKAKRVIPFLLIAEEWVASVSSIGQRDKKKQLFAQIVRSVCDLLLRYGFNDGQYKATGKIGKMEMVSSALPRLYDAGMNSWDLAMAYQRQREEFQEGITEQLLDKTPGKEYKIASCPICYVEYETGDDIDVTTNCGNGSVPHVFHHKCLQTWFTEKNTCPLCNKCHPTVKTMKCKLPDLNPNLSK
ncbi:RING finger protein [Candidatus Dependentiae bacterium]|nr:RING finger protein [Candidatus Dependentiae bacterium]